MAIAILLIAVILIVVATVTLIHRRNNGATPSFFDPEDWEVTKPVAEFLMNQSQVRNVDPEMQHIHAWLEVTRGSTGSPLVTVYDGMVIGRGRGVDVQLTDRRVSRRHAVIRIVNGVCYLQDQHSVNGTFVNRRRISAAPLKDGDKIQIGDAEIVFHSR